MLKKTSFSVNSDKCTDLKVHSAGASQLRIDCLTNLDCQLLEGERFADQLSSWIAHAIMHNRIAGKAGREQDLEIGIAPQGFVGQAASVDVGVVRLRRLRGSRRLQVSPPTEKQS